MEDKTISSRIKEFLFKHRFDLMLVLLLAFISVTALIILNLTRTEGGSVEVTVDGERVATYSLSESGEYRIGEGNILVIEDGKAYMKSADCPDHTCVKTGAISFVNESIVCLPNKVAVKVISGKPGIDLVS